MNGKTEMFADRLVTEVLRKQSHVVVGLDPHVEQFPAEFRQDIASGSREVIADAIERFSISVLDAVSDIAVAVKPQVAFFERLGPPGWNCLERVVDAAKQRSLLVISDCKRGDIGTTAAAYAQYHIGIDSSTSALKPLGADAVTVNPYLGTDSIRPFVDYVPSGKGIFLLAKTSNPTSAEMQDLLVKRGSTESTPVYEVVADLADELNRPLLGSSGYGSIGIVVGATNADPAVQLRRRHLSLYFLVPGYGAQGATAEDIVGCFDRHGLGAVINASRSILFAHNSSRYAHFGEANWASACRAAATDMRDEINAVLLNAHRIAW